MKPDDQSIAIRQGLRSREKVGTAVLSDIDQLLRHFLAGVKQHIEKTMVLAFGKSRYFL